MIKTNETNSIKKPINQKIKNTVILPTKNNNSASSSKSRPVYTRAPYKTENPTSKTINMPLNQTLKRRSASSDNSYPYNQLKTNDIFGNNKTVTENSPKNAEIKAQPDISNINDTVENLTTKMTNLNTDLAIQKKIKNKSYPVSNFSIIILYF